MNRCIVCCLFFLVPLTLSVSFGQKEGGASIRSADGVEISFHSEGRGAPALILVHGWANDRTIWSEQVSYFAPKQRVVAVDLPGFGKSGHNRDEWTMSAFGEDIVAVAEGLDLDEIVLVGFSLGGPVVVEAASRLADRVIGVVLVDVLQDVNLQFSPEAAAQLEDYFLDLVVHPVREKMVAGGFILEDSRDSYRRVLSMLEGGPRPGWRESVRAFTKWQTERCREALREVEAPITAINSDRLPTDAAAFREVVPSYQVKILPGTAHVVMWDATEEFNRLLEESIEEFKSR